jgi:hypothetical protein
VPLYFFHIHDGSYRSDNVGTTLATDHEARTEALIAAGEILRDLGRAGWHGIDWSMNVVDEGGTRICELKFSAHCSGE